MKKTFYPLLVLFLCVSCLENKDKQVVRDVEVLEMSNFESTSFLAIKENIVEKSDLVKLELTDASLVGQIAQMELADDFIYILDSKVKTLLLFDKNGSFVRTIGKRGNGPGEYTSIASFYVDAEENKIGLLDPLALKVHQYTLQGEYVKSVSFKDNGYSHIKRMDVLNEHDLCCFTSAGWNEGCGYFVIDKSDYTKKEQLYSYPFLPSGFISYSVNTSPFCIYDGAVKFVTPFSDSIYCYDGEKVQATYYLNNGLKEIEPALLQQYATTADSDYFSVMKRIKDDGVYTQGLNNYFETERFIWVEYGIIGNAWVWDKELNEGFVFDGYYSTKPYMNNIVYCKENTLVRVWKNHEIFSYKNALAEGNVSQSDIPQEWNTLIENYTEDDNPMLLLWTMKK